MKKLIVLFSFVFLLGLLLQPVNVQAQDTSASDKEYQVNFVMSHIHGWMWLMDWTWVRTFTTKSGKVQYKMDGWWGWWRYEIVINVNATGEEGATEGINCVANGTVYDWWGNPMICGHNQQFVTTLGVFLDWGPWMIVNMDWAPCVIE